ncbi:MAG: fimbrial protein [Deltaproteobacteria bacterium]|jgi:type IV pilus assembly protein PilN|nr:MAG: fimbrial protein [Deltaproteobacteria bacterium]
MILINLLPVRAAKKREFGRQQLVLFVLLLVLAGIGNFFVYNRFESELRSLDKQIVTTRAEIAQLEKTIGEVKSIKEDKKALEDKLKILDTLKKGRTGPVKVLDELATIIPQKVWIVDFNEQGGAVAMNGAASSYEDLSNFSKKLKASTHFSNITIKTARQRADGTVDWVITCNTNYSA